MERDDATPRDVDSNGISVHSPSLTPEIPSTTRVTTGEIEIGPHGSDGNRVFPQEMETEVNVHDAATSSPTNTNVIFIFPSLLLVAYVCLYTFSLHWHL